MILAACEPSLEGLNSNGQPDRGSRRHPAPPGAGCGMMRRRARGETSAPHFDHCKESRLSRSLLLAVLFALSSTAGAVVIRHDVEDSAYRIPASAFPALVDMPGEGHGVLIAPQWVITAAHTLPAQAPLQQVELDGRPRKVE